jgi:hypothetical protein
MPRTYSPHIPVEAAVADVVQRCIEGGAAQVDVAVEFAGAQSWIRIASDSAAAPPPPGAGPPTPAGLDVLSACLTQGTGVNIAGDGGTVVTVEHLHEVLAYKRKEGRVIEAAVARMRSRIDAALGLAYHRLLGDGGRGVAITVNAVPVRPRTPFPQQGHGMQLPARELPFVVDGRVETIVATPHVLALGDQRDPTPGRQGFFVYVRDRLVQAGSWSRLSIQDRRDAVARVAVDLPPAALASFGWEAVQRRVLFPVGVTPALRAVAVEAITCAQLGLSTPSRHGSAEAPESARAWATTRSSSASAATTLASAPELLLTSPASMPSATRPLLGS